MAMKMEGDGLKWMDGTEWMDGEGGRLMDGDVDGWRQRWMEIEMEGDRDGGRWDGGGERQRWIEMEIH